VISDLDMRLWSSSTTLGAGVCDALRRRASSALETIEIHEERFARAIAVVDRAFLLGFRSAHLQSSIPNDYVANVARRYPDKVLPVAGIDPMDASWADDLDRARALGHVAITVSPSLQGYAPSHSRAMRVWERCADARIPVIVSRVGPLPGQALLEFERPVLWDEPLRHLPNLTLVFAGLGAPFFEETLVLLAKHARTFAQLAGAARRPLDAYRWLSAAIDAGVADRLLFASGFPFDTPAAAIERLFTLNTVVHGTTLPGIPRRDIEAIVRRDAFAALGIADPIAVRPMGDKEALLAAARSLLSDR
jgi:predicted TIM-barrel fold metal-dependent hydrolase